MRGITRARRRASSTLLPLLPRPRTIDWEVPCAASVLTAGASSPAAQRVVSPTRRSVLSTGFARREQSGWALGAAALGTPGKGEPIPRSLAQYHTVRAVWLEADSVLCFKTVYVPPPSRLLCVRCCMQLHWSIACFVGLCVKRILFLQGALFNCFSLHSSWSICSAGAGSGGISRYGSHRDRFLKRQDDLQRGIVLLVSCVDYYVWALQCCIKTRSLSAAHVRIQILHATATSRHTNKQTHSGQRQGSGRQQYQA